MVKSEVTSDTATLYEWYDTGIVDSYNRKNIGYNVNIGDSKVSLKTAFDIYFELINARSRIFTLDSQQQGKYRRNLERLCEDVYGSREFLYLILKLNNLSHEADFNSNKVRLIGPTKDNIAFLNRILYLNEKDLKNNHLEVK